MAAIMSQRYCLQDSPRSTGVYIVSHESRGRLAVGLISLPVMRNKVCAISRVREPSPPYLCK